MDPAKIEAVGKTKDCNRYQKFFWVWGDITVGLCESF